MKHDSQTGQARTIIQIVRVTWSKRSRGGPLATRRNSVPVALPFRCAGFDVSESMWIEQQNWDEPSFSASRYTWRSSQSRDFHFHGLVLRHLADVTIIAGTPRLGAPERYAPVRYDLRDGQVARLRWNGRLLDFDMGTWSYELISLNVARITGEVPPDVFTSRPPNFSFQSLARLR